MRKETELNRERAEQLALLMREHPEMRVIAWMDTDGMNDDYAYMAGNLGEPCIETIAFSENTERYISKEGDDYEDCLGYYGYDADDWSDEELTEKAKNIPWEDVIAVKVSAM